MTYLLIDLGNEIVKCEANLSYRVNHIVLAFQAKDHMLEISAFITDRFNNGDLLEKLTLQFDKENIKVDLKNSSIGKHSIASEAFCMNQVTFALQNIKIRLWQAVKILKGYWNFITRSPRQVVFR